MSDIDSVQIDVIKSIINTLADNTSSLSNITTAVWELKRRVENLECEVVLLKRLLEVKPDGLLN